jgi:hypothetical protein
VYLLVVNDFVPSIVLGEPFIDALLDLLNHRFETVRSYVLIRLDLRCCCVGLGFRRCGLIGLDCRFCDCGESSFSPKNELGKDEYRTAASDFGEVGESSGEYPLYLLDLPNEEFDWGYLRSFLDAFVPPVSSFLLRQ